MSNFLRYGDLVSFRFEGGLSLDKGQGPAGSIGFISGTGFLDPRIYMQTVKWEGGQANPDQLPNLTNYREFIFRITPKLNFEFHKDYKKTLTQYQKFMKQLNLKKEVSKDRLEIKKNYEEKLVKLKERVSKEKILNEQVIASSSGSFLNYGNEIQLMHRDSGYFVHALDECSQTKKIGYYCALSNWFSTRMVFQILPRFKSREVGDYIQSSEHVLLKNTYNMCFINFVEEKTEIYTESADHP